jgi:multiple sugar transport system substrate-binding protein
MRMRTATRATVATVALALATATVPAASAQSDADWGSIDWRQFEGESLNVLATAMPVSDVYAPAIAGFEDLTGITVNFTQLNDTDRKNAQLVDFQGGTGEYCVSNVGISNREEFVAGDYLEPLQPYLDNASLTDAAWYDISDYADGVLAGGYSGADPASGTLVYLPFTAEYFLLWYRQDIFDRRPSRSFGPQPRHWTPRARTAPSPSTPGPTVPNRVPVRAAGTSSPRPIE